MIDTRACQKIHTRNIAVTIFTYTADTIVVEGHLKDDRLIDSFRSGGDAIPPGVVHNRGVVQRQRVANSSDQCG